jgi:CRISPR-associated endonuclease/helicase Cas3
MRIFTGGFWNYWGKAKPGHPLPYHPLVYHQLDVAACAWALLDANPVLIERLAAALGGSPAAAAVVRTVVLLAGNHDSGKFARAFQAVVPEICRLLGAPDRSPIPSRGDTRHDNLGLALWAAGALCEPVLGVEINDTCLRRLIGTPSFGHHGYPPNDAALYGKLPLVFDAPGRATAVEFARAFREAVGPGEIALPVDEDAAKRASLIVAAVINVADWLGSSTDCFPYRPPLWDLRRYWRGAQARARRAVRQTGLIAAPPAAAGSFRTLYADKTATPLQQILNDLPLPEQFLLIAEETTGGGKTEGAMTVAARRLTTGTARGIFFGLPTMTTADAQAARQADIYRQLFDPEIAASLTVSHSGVRRGLTTAGVDCASWILDDRRRRLLADVCVGTVDQALLAAMPARFAAVRIFALLGKLLILDEVHSFDAYTSGLIANLLALHAALGGSAVLLSATLTAKIKNQFGVAFTKAAAFPTPDPEKIATLAYPLVTVIGPAGTETHEPDPAPRAPPDKSIRFVRSVENAERAVLDASRAGHCVAWIRNTVDQAIESGASLRARSDAVTVFHSRFPEADLHRIRDRVLHDFGKTSTAETRRDRNGHGRIVVATAVIEQSLDLDFDLVVVDLKPLDAIIQGLGRGRRHPRDADGNPLPDGERDQRVPMPMIVLAPDSERVTGPGWYGNLLDKARFIHRDSGLLWRSAVALQRAGGVRYAEIRSLVESAYAPDDDFPATPACFTAASDRAEGIGYADASAARALANGLGPTTGYVFTNGFWDDARVPTRLGDSAEIVLVRQTESGSIVPYAGNSWSSGRMRIAYRRVRQGLDTAKNRSEFSNVLKMCSYTLPVILTSGVHAGDTIDPCGVVRESGLVWAGDGSAEFE